VLVRLPVFLDATLLRFLVVGFANTAVGLGVIFCAKALGLGDVTANMVGYAVALMFSFALNKQWTFGFRGRAAAAFLRFLLVFAVAYAANLAVVVLLIDHAGVESHLAHLLGIVPYTALFYAGSRWYTFDSPRET